LEILRHAFVTATHRCLQQRQSRFALAAATLDVVSPLATLQRGYAIVSNAQGHVVTNAETLKVGDAIRARLAKGTVHARIDAIEAVAKETPQP
jgi:exodeoxyribonuclease VII large subunit